MILFSLTESARINAPPGTLHALAASASQAIPHPLHDENDESVRPFVPGATPVRLTHVVPQQRWLAEHVGEHIPLGPASTPGIGRLPSTPGMLPG